MLKPTYIKIAFCVTLVFSYCYRIHAQTEDAVIDYVSVLSEDSTVIAWETLDASIFNSYILEYSNDFLSWQSVFSSSNIDDTSFYHEINPASNQHIYRLRNGNLDTSDWVRTIKFDLFTFQNTDSSINLSWFKPMFDFSNTNYYVERRLEAGAWTLMDTTEAANPSYQDTIIVCELTDVQFRVFYISKLGHKSNSHIISYTQTPYDLPQPAPDTISVVDGEKLAISWQPLDIGYVNGYYIRKYQFNGFYTIDSVDGGDSNHWESTLNSNINFNSGSVSILISARKSCGGTTISSENVMHTIFLSEPDIHICQKSFDLEWTAHSFFNSDLAHYRVFVLEDEILVKDTLTQDTSYTFHGLNDNKTYEAYVRAIDVSGSKTSTSNRQSIVFNYPDVTDSVRIYTPSIVEDSKAKLDFSSFPSGIPSTYYLMRSEEEYGTYENVDSIILSANAQLSIEDPNPDFDQQPYFYRIQVKDSCRQNVFKSIPVSTLNLKGETTTRQYNSLNWNNIDNPHTNVISYNIFRSIDGESNPSGAIQSLNDQSFEDDLFSYEDFFDFATGEGFFEYYIEAVVDQNGEQYAVFSNILELEQITEIFIPNAFAPNGSNPIFKPVSIFIQEDGFSMYIYNKWGELVFETHDKNQGWDGTFNGEAMPQDVYAYYIKYKDSAGAAREKKGAVTLIR